MADTLVETTVFMSAGSPVDTSVIEQPWVEGKTTMRYGEISPQCFARSSRRQFVFDSMRYTAEVVDSSRTVVKQIAVVEAPWSICRYDFEQIADLEPRATREMIDRMNFGTLFEAASWQTTVDRIRKYNSPQVMKRMERVQQGLSADAPPNPLGSGSRRITFD